jgi:hypothetical protein
LEKIKEVVAKWAFLSSRKKSMCYNASSSTEDDMHLTLTFPYRGSNKMVALGCANGVSLRYEVRKTMTGSWQLTIWPTERSRSEERAFQFTSERAAKGHARADFRRRQLVRLAA